MWTCGQSQGRKERGVRPGLARLRAVSEASGIPGKLSVTGLQPGPCLIKGWSFEINHPHPSCVLQYCQAVTREVTREGFLEAKTEPVQQPGLRWRTVLTETQLMHEKGGGREAEESCHHAVHCCHTHTPSFLSNPLWAVPVFLP